MFGFPFGEWSVVAIFKAAAKKFMFLQRYLPLLETKDSLHSPKGNLNNIVKLYALLLPPNNFFHGFHDVGRVQVEEL